MAEPPRTTFVDLMALEPIAGSVGEVSRYMSKTPAWAPGGVGAAYGGHVYAQAVWAAAQTVDDGMVVHNVHGYFTLPGLTDRPFIYTITASSSGRSYCTRVITVRQPTIPSQSSSPLPIGSSHKELCSFGSADAENELGKICFIAICSFKRDEKISANHQADVQLEDVYASVIAGKTPEMHVDAPSIDAPWYYKYAALHPQPTTFPGLDIRKVDMSAYNSGKAPIDYRQLSYYRLIGDVPAGQYNLHCVVHLFASDRNSLFLISSALNFADQVAKMGSLSHSVVFHVDSKNLLFRGEGDKGEWFCQEAWTPRSEGGRGIHESRIWDSRGVHVASSWQDGLVRRMEGEGRQKRDYEEFARAGRGGEKL